MKKLTNKIISGKARALGFDLVGFASAEKLSDEIIKLNKWLESGYQSGMRYMERNADKREDVSLILPGAKSVISLGINYYKNGDFSEIEGKGKVSRYAWGKDYHYIIWEKLEKLISSIKEIDPAFEAKSYVDTGPVMDKIWAVKAGLGWQGKHTNVISREIGSWFFIATVICNRELDYGISSPDFCGSCTACIDACPTGAIVDEYVLDANRCISYLTIENKGEIADEFKGKFDDWIFGCDICQDVCPWNHKSAVPAKAEEFKSAENKELDLKEIEAMTNREFKMRFEKSPVARARLKGLKRNAAFIEGKSL